MNSNYIYISKEEFNYINDKEKKVFDSKFLKNYKKKALEIKQKNAWKNSGDGAKFMQGADPADIMNPNQNLIGEIKGVCFNKEKNNLVYSAKIEDASGIFEVKEQDENIIIQDHKLAFYNLDINSKNSNITISISDNSYEQHIAIIKEGSTNITMLTEGSTIEDNPHWSCFEDGVIYYDSKGLGFDDHGNVVGFSDIEILKVDITKGELSEVVSEKDFDFMFPKTDSKGNVYCIKKPRKSDNETRVSFKDVISIPFKLTKGIVAFFDFFTMKYSGDTFFSRGQNPTKTKSEDPRQIFIQDNLIQVSKNIEESKHAGEKFPGLAPRSWELIKINSSGEISTIKKGVLCYDISSDGEIIYSNGSYLVSVSKEGEETKLDKVELVEKVNIM